MKKFFSIFLFFLFLHLYIINPLPAFSSNVTPNTYIWNKKILNVYINNDNQIIKSLFKDWQKKTGNYFKFNFTENRSNADILVLITDSNVKMLGAYTKYYFNDENIIRAEIILPLKNFNETQLEQPFKQFIIKHEIGHSLGIYKHSSNKSDIMYPVKTDENFDITSNDITLLKNVYQKKNKDAVSQNPEDYKYDLPYLANVYKRAGKFDKAIEIYDKILDDNPDFSLALYSKGYCYFKMKEYTKACSNAEKAYKLEADNEIFLNLYIKCLCKINKHKTAEIILTNFTKNNPKLKDSALVNDCFRALNK